MTLLTVVALALTGCGRGDPVASPSVTEVTLTARPLAPTAAAEASPTEPEPVDPTPGPTASGTPAPSASLPATPGASERARFVAAYRPEGASGLDHVAVDLDDDGIQDLLFSFVVDMRTRVEIAWWGEDGYAIASRGEGGSATLIDEVRVSDLTGDDRPEIVSFQRDDVGSSLSVWSVTESRDLVGLRARGGCDDGAYTYGVVGADLADIDGDGSVEIIATCDDSPLPVRNWSEDTYRWDGDVYAVVPRLPPSPSPSPSPSPTDGGSGSPSEADGDGDDDDDDGDGD